MRRLGVFIFCGITSFMFIATGIHAESQKIIAAKADGQNMVYVGGIAAGFTLKTRGVQVIGLCEVMTENGVFSPALNSGVRMGDRIEKIGGIMVDSILKLNEILDKNKPEDTLSGITMIIRLVQISSLASSLIRSAFQVKSRAILNYGKAKPARFM